MGKVEIFADMANPLETELPIELFQNHEDQEFRVSSSMEILSILRGIAKHNSRICLHYGDVRDSFMTALLGLNEHGMWLDADKFAPEDRLILLDDKITFVSMHQHVKVQFEAGNIVNGLFCNRKAFYLNRPDTLLRIQRREFFRSSIPSIGQARCIIPVQQEDPDDRATLRAAPLMDISGGGIRLLCNGDDATLLPNKTFTDCQISLPDEDTLTVNIEVRNSTHFTAANNEVYKRVGCRFVSLNNQTNIQLQRHINRLQGENVARRRVAI